MAEQANRTEWGVRITSDTDPDYWPHDMQVRYANEDATDEDNRERAEMIAARHPETREVISRAVTRTAWRVMAKEDAPARTIIAASSFEIARDWCRDNGVDVRARTTLVLTAGNAAHGLRLNPRDRVVKVSKPGQSAPFALIEHLRVLEATRVTPPITPHADDRNEES